MPMFGECSDDALRPALPAEAIFARHLGDLTRRTDRLFAALLAFQWFSAAVTALLTSPRIWNGYSSRISTHVWVSTLLGGAILGLPIALALRRAGATSTRHVMAVAQVSMGALLIHLFSGRIETHFHVLVSLALLTLYHDWRVLVTASAVVALDQSVRGWYWPNSVLGVFSANPWWWTENMGWVAVEGVFLIRSCVEDARAMRDAASREADLIRANQDLAHEVGESKRAKQAQALMAATLDATTDFVGIVDASGRVRYVNGAGLRMVGMTAALAPGTTIGDYHPEWVTDLLIHEGLPAATREGVWENEVALRRRDGSEIPVSVVILAHKDSLGNIEYYSTIARDISERKQTELALLMGHDALEARVAERTADLSRANDGLAREAGERQRAEEAQARMAAILNATTDFVAIADVSGRTLYVNPAGLRMVGIREEDVFRTSIADYHPDWAHELLVKKGLPAAIDDGAWSGEIALLRRDGGEIPVSVVTLSHNDSSGNVEFFSTIARDVTERKRAEQDIRILNSQLELRLSRLNALRQIDIAIATSFDLGLTLDTLLDHVLAQLGVDAANIVLLDSRSQTLRSVTGKGFRTALMQPASLSLGQSLPGFVARQCTALHLSDLSKETRPYARAQAVAEEGFVTYSAVPLVSRGVVKGVLEVFHRSPLDANQEWLDFLATLAEQAAVAVDSATLFQDLQRSNAEMTVAYDATIEGWSRALDLRDKETEGHTKRVTEMSVRLARAMGMTGDDLVNVRRGALLHDVGKLGVPDAILLKPGKLTEEEWVVMRRHPSYAHEWLSPIAFLHSALDIPYCHHEHWDGSGYPRGLKGEEIPLAARIFAAVDVWDALRSDRPYRLGWTAERVLDHIESLAGNHLDPAVVDEFLRYQAEVSKLVRIASTSAKSTGLTTCLSKPASSASRRSASSP